MQGIYNYIPETNLVSRVYSVAALLYLQIWYIKFYVHATVHRNFMLINVQQDATIHSLFYL